MRRERRANLALKLRCRRRSDAIRTLLSPFAPHLAEEMWTRLGFDGLASQQAWPVFDENKVREATDGKTVAKVIVVPGKLVNVVVR